MIELKYKAKRIGEMSDKLKAAWAEALLLKIHVITGWVVPEGKMLTILVDQFGKKLVEQYHDLNTEEIEFAFRSAGTTIEDWGKAMNLNLIDKVLLPYRDTRHRLSEDEERLKQPPEQKVYTDEQTDNLHRQETEACYQRFLNGNASYFPKLLMTEILVKDKLMKPKEDVQTFFHECAKSKRRHLYEKQLEKTEV